MHDGRSRVDYVAAAGDPITVTAVARRRRVPCPACDTVARRVHSHHSRGLVALPRQGVRVRLAVSVRRFLCDGEVNAATISGHGPRSGNVCSDHAARRVPVSTPAVTISLTNGDANTAADALNSSPSARGTPYEMSYSHATPKRFSYARTSLL